MTVSLPDFTSALIRSHDPIEETFGPVSGIQKVICSPYFANLVAKRFLPSSASDEKPSQSMNDLLMSDIFGLTNAAAHPIRRPFTI